MRRSTRRSPSMPAPWIVCALLAPALSGQESRQTVRIPSAEGIELATDVYHPATEPAPVVVVRTPYGRRGMAFLAEPLARHGYAVAVQDVRGKYDSTGDHEPFRHERVDGLHTLRWIAEQEWCDGNVGMWGSSYSGYAALAVADAELPAFRSIFSISGWLDAEQVVRPGGANHLMLNLAWMVSQQGRSQRSLREFDMDALFRHTPLRDALRSVGIRNATWEDPEWVEAGAAIELGAVPRPVFHLTGWHDMVYRATLDAWQRVAADGGQPHKLAIGPWYHNQFLFGSWEVGDADFGRVSGLGTDEMVALSLQWFDATLRGADNGMLERPAVTYFMMGQNAWHRDTAWPPPEVERQSWYLTSEAGANGSGGDGALVLAQPEGERTDGFVFDPNDPVPTLGGANFFYFPELVGVRDQRSAAARDDVLVYTSQPLESSIQITGNVGRRPHPARCGTQLPAPESTRHDAHGRNGRTSQSVRSRRLAHTTDRGSCVTRPYAHAATPAQCTRNGIAPAKQNPLPRPPAVRRLRARSGDPRCVGLERVASRAKEASQEIDRGPGADACVGGFGARSCRTRWRPRNGPRGSR